MSKTDTPAFETTRKETMEFLMANTTAVVATSADNVPYASTVYYIVDEDFNFYFVTEVETQKYLNISRNSKVALVVGTGPSHISVTVQGMASLVSDNEKTAVIERIIDLMLREHVDAWPAAEMERMKKNKMAAFVVSPQRLTFMNLDDKNYSGSMSNGYMTIIPKP